VEVPTVEEMDCGRCSIRSWQEFQAELKAQFMPGNVSWMARQALFNLKPVRCEMNVHQVVIDAGYIKKRHVRGGQAILHEGAPLFVLGGSSRIAEAECRGPGRGTCSS